MKRLLVVLIGLLPGSSFKNLCLNLLGFSIAKKSHIAPNVFWNLKLLEMSYGSKLGAFNVFRDCEIQLYEFAKIGSWNWVSSAISMSLDSNYEGKLVLGNRSFITSRHYLDVTGGIFVDDNSIIAGHRSTLLTHQVNRNLGIQEAKSIKIGSQSEILSSVLMAPGAIIGSKTRIAMGAVCIGRKYEDGYLYGGNPAIKKKLINEFII